MKPRYNPIHTGRPNDSAEYLVSTLSNVNTSIMEGDKRGNISLQGYSDHFQFHYYTEGPPLPISRFLAPRAVPSTLSIEPHLNSFKRVKGLVWRIKRSSYSLAYNTTPTNSSRAELLLTIKSSVKGKSCPVTRGSAQDLEDAGSPPKTTMDNLGQVTYSLTLGYMGKISVMQPYRNIKID